jgi:hypothetical protein
MATIRRMARIALSSIATAFVGMALLFAANFALTWVPIERYQRVVDDAIKSGVLAAQHYQLFGPQKPIYSYGFNDCLMLGMLMMPRESRIKAAVSPRMPIQSAGKLPDRAIKASLPPRCELLIVTLEAIGRGEVDERRPEPAHYHRYLHGDVTVMALLLSVMSIVSASRTMLATCYFILLAILLSALIGLRDARQAEAKRMTAFIVIAAVLMTFYGVGTFDHAYSFGPIDAVIFAFVLVGLWWPLGQMPEHAVVVLAAAFGTLIAILEFLTGGIPMGLAVLITLLALGESHSRTSLVRRLAIGVAAFGVAGVTCVVIKLAAVWLIWGSNETETFFAALANHTVSTVSSRFSPEALAILSGYHIDARWIDANHVTRILFAGAMLTYSAFLIGWGSHILGAAIVLFPAPALLCLAYLALRRRTAAEWPVERLALIVAGLVPIAWYMVLPNHTMFHSSYMVRPLAMTFALALIVSPLSDRFAAALTHRVGRIERAS